MSHHQGHTPFLMRASNKPHIEKSAEWNQLRVPKQRPAKSHMHAKGPSKQNPADAKSAHLCSGGMEVACPIAPARRAISDDAFCTIMHWAHKGGIKECGPYAKAPGAPSGHCSRFLNKNKLPTAAHRPLLMGVEVPAFGSDDTAPSRTLHTLTVIPSHEALDANCAMDGCFTKLQEAIDNQELPPCYWTHPVVQESAEDVVVPIALYLDGVQYSNVDSVIGFWVINLTTGARQLLVALRKRLLCRCGCRGYCTMYPVFRFLAWSFNAAANGKYPLRDFLGREWPEGSRRRALANTQLQARFALLYIKGDWAEYASSLGFPSWQSNLRPCYACNVAPADMQVCVGKVESNSFMVWHPLPSAQPHRPPTH